MREEEIDKKYRDRVARLVHRAAVNIAKEIDRMFDGVENAAKLAKYSCPYYSSALVDLLLELKRIDPNLLDLVKCEGPYPLGLVWDDPDAIALRDEIRDMWDRHARRAAIRLVVSNPEQPTPGT
jgi:hypothetical protein